MEERGFKLCFITITTILFCNVKVTLRARWSQISELFMCIAILQPNRLKCKCFETPEMSGMKRCGKRQTTGTGTIDLHSINHSSFPYTKYAMAFWNISDKRWGSKRHPFDVVFPVYQQRLISNTPVFHLLKQALQWFLQGLFSSFVSLFLPCQYQLVG